MREELSTSYCLKNGNFSTPKNEQPRSSCHDFLVAAHVFGAAAADDEPAGWQNAFPSESSKAF